MKIKELTENSPTGAPQKKTPPKIRIPKAPVASVYDGTPTAAAEPVQVQQVNDPIVPQVIHTKPQPAAQQKIPQAAPAEPEAAEPIQIPHATDPTAPQTAQSAQETAQPARPKFKSAYEVLVENFSPDIYNYEQEIRNAEKQRKLAVFGDIANVIADSVTLNRGGTPIPTRSNQLAATDRYDRYRELQRRAGAEMAARRYSAALQDEQMKRQDWMFNEKQKGEDQKLRFAYQKWLAELQDKDAKNQIASKKLDLDREYKEKNYELGKKKTAAYQQAVSQQAARSTAGKTPKPVDPYTNSKYFVYRGSDGKEYVFEKNKWNSLANSYYTKMAKEVVSRDDVPFKLNLMFDDSSPIPTQISSRVATFLQYFPELEQQILSGSLKPEQLKELQTKGSLSTEGEAAPDQNEDFSQYFEGATSTSSENPEEEDEWEKYMLK